MKITITDGITGESITRDMTAEEAEHLKQLKAEEEARQNEIAAKVEAKAALLAKLGLTAEEAELLLK